MQPAPAWRLDMGASIIPAGVRFRVWAPVARQVEVQISEPRALLLPMQRGQDGVWEAVLAEHGAGVRYTYRLHGEAAFPDPYARSQPSGVHGPSEVIDPAAYSWRDHTWQGVSLQGLVIYECHIGTATPQGTCDALIGQLDQLKQLGVTALQLMPVAAFPGRRNWGYDGIYPFAVSANYGGPTALKRLVDAAHQCGLGVVLDVVYNHLGPEGNYFRHFSPYYFSARYRTPWGEAFNYDGPHSRWVRKLAIDNACYWLHEYHIDGLRLDATAKMFDASQPHILQELTQAVRASLPAHRSVVLIAENSENEVRYLAAPDSGGYGFDAVWADDFAWSLRRYATGEHEGRYQDYQGTLDEVARTINQGFLYEGQWSSYTGGPRGTSARQQPAWHLQYCLQHHDHVGNRAYGERLHHQLDLAGYGVASALFLLVPYTPLIFMGQEFAASSPFLFFTDHSPELGQQVAAGRRREFSRYAAFASDAAAAGIPDPQAADTFERSRLPLHERLQRPGSEVQTLYRELLWLRRNDAVLCRQERRCMQARLLAPDVLAVIWQPPRAWRALLANFGGPASVRLAELFPGAPEASWQILLQTCEARFGGSGTMTVIRHGVLHIPTRTAVLLAGEQEASNAHLDPPYSDAVRQGRDASPRRPPAGACGTRARPGCHSETPTGEVLSGSQLVTYGIVW